MNVPCEQADELANFLSHGTCATAKVVLKQLANEALQYQNLSDGRVGG